MYSTYGKKRKAWKMATVFMLVACLLIMPFRFEGPSARADDTRVFDVGVNTDSVKAELSADGKLRLTGVGETRDYTPETAPFAGLAVTSLEIGGGVSSIGSYLFYNCGGLTGELILPAGLVSLGEGAFSGDQAKLAPKFSLIDNQFTECTITAKKTDLDTGVNMDELSTAGGTADEKKDTSQEALSSAAVPAMESDETASPAPTHTDGSEAASELENSSLPAGPDTAESLSPEGSSAVPESSPVPEGSSQPAISPSPQTGEGQYTLETITEQRIGHSLFFSGIGENSFFLCSRENGNFRNAAELAGYVEADRVITAAFDCGEGNGGTVVANLPVSAGEVILPQAPQEFTAPEGGELFAYSFKGWTESQDGAGVVRQPGAPFSIGVREDLYFIASWDREVLIRLLVERGGNTLKLTVPEIEGYDITSVRWQIGEIPEGEELMPEDAPLLSWKDIEGQSGLSYERQLQPGDEQRGFRCVLTVAKHGILRLLRLSGEEDLILAPVRGAAAGGAHILSCLKGSYNNGAAFPAGDDPVPQEVQAGDYAIIPDCPYDAPLSSDGVVVFNGWLGSDGETYDPGDMVCLNDVSGSLSLTAQWTVAAVRYVQDGGSVSGGDGTKEAPYGSLNDALNSFSGGSVYSNIVVLLSDLADAEGYDRVPQDFSRQKATITSVEPGGPQAQYTLTLDSNGAKMGGDTRFEHIRITRKGDIFAQGHKLILGKNVTTTDSSLHLFGGNATGDLAADTNIVVQSGSYGGIYGGSRSGSIHADNAKGIAGTTRVSVSGSASSEVVIGGCWKDGTVAGQNEDGYGTEVLLSENAAVGIVSGAGRSANEGALVTSRTHVMVGGNAHILRQGDQSSDGNYYRGFVSGGGFEAVDGPGGGSAQNGALVEIRENAVVDGEVFGGSGDMRTSSSAESDPSLTGTTGDTEILMTGGIAAHVYGAGRDRAVKGNTRIKILSGTVTGSVYGGGRRGAVQGDTQTEISGGIIQGSVYAGGEQGAVSGNSRVSQSGGTVEKSLYGGGRGDEADRTSGVVSGNSQVSVVGGVLGSADEIGNPVAGTGNVFGGGEYAETQGSSSVVIGSDASQSFSIAGSIYGGGTWAPVASSTVELKSGEVRGSIFGASYGSPQASGKGEVAISGGTVQGSVYGGGELGITNDQGTQVLISGGVVSGSVFGAGRGDITGGDPSAGCVYGPAIVLISGGKITGGVYGGGEYGLVGDGTLSGIGSDAAMTDTQVSSTSVTISGGTVGTSVYGGGSGGEGVSGAVFGSTAVTVTGGTINGGIFGGGNRSFVSGDTEISVKAEQADAAIGGTVYGGGNLPGGDAPQYQEIYLVQGSAGILIDGSGTHELSIGGSVCGGGNLTLVKGSGTKITIRDFRGTLQSIQRSPKADIMASTLYLTGADDVTEQVTRYYSVSQVGDLRLVDGSLLRVDKETRELGAMGNYVWSGTECVPSTAEGSRSTLQVCQGKRLEVKAGGVYGTVSGVLWLDIAAEAGSSGREFGVSVQAGPDSAVGDGSTNTGAFVRADTENSRNLPFVSGIVADSHCFWRLGNAVSQVELTIRAVHESNGGTGLVEQAFTMSTSKESSIFRITERTQTDGFFLVKPTEKPDGGMEALPPFEGGQSADNTFALRVNATDSEGIGAWTDTGAGCYVLTSEEMHGSSVPGIWKRGTAFPTTAVSGPGAGNEAEVTFQLFYSPNFTNFCGGTLELVFQEYRSEGEPTQETLEGTTVVKLTIESDNGNGVSREAYVSAGRRFEELSSKDTVSLEGTGAVTAYFVTCYYPVSAGAQNMTLSLYRVNGGDREPAVLPEGTKVVLGDLSAAGAYQYYMLRSTGRASLGLSEFASMGDGGASFYPGPVNNTEQITEKLLVTLDFSEAAAELSEGEYVLRLSHGVSETAVQAAGFAITSPQPSSLNVALSKTGTWTIQAVFTPSIPKEDTRFVDGAQITLALTDYGGLELGFPGKAKFINAENLLRSADGRVSFVVSPSDSTTVILDFSEVSSEILPSDIYGLRAELRPRTGLQVSTDSGPAHFTSQVKTFELDSEIQPQRAISVKLDSGERVVEVKDASATLQFTLEAHLESGDKLKALLYQKVGDGPGKENYSLMDKNSWCRIGSMSAGKAVAVLTIPQGTAAGTYRVEFMVVDQGGTPSAQEPYNFIVK